MIKTDENALVCDLAETYHIYDYRQLPPTKVAVFACGLKDNSRIKMRLSGSTISFQTTLLAGIADRLSILLWLQTKDAQKGRNRPKMILDMLTKQDQDVVTFASGKDFELELKRLRGGE